MAAVSIGALRYDVIADTVQFEKGLTATRKELRNAEKAFRAAMTPAEKYENEIKRLGDMHRKGLIDSRTYNRQLEKTRALLRKTGSTARTTADRFGKLRSVAMGMVGAFSARAAIQQFGEALQEVDAIAKESRVLDISTTTFQAIERMAKDSGVEVTALSASLKAMTRRLGEAALTGKGEAAPALDQLGLSIDKLMAMNPEQRFKAISAALAGVGDSAKRMALADKIFSESGRAMNEMFKNVKDLNTYRAEVERLGLTFDDVDAQKIEEINDQLSRFGDTLKGFARDRAVNAATAIADLTPGSEAARLESEIQGRMRDLAEARGELDAFDAAQKATVESTEETMTEFNRRIIKEIGGGLDRARAFVMGGPTEEQNLMNQRLRNASLKNQVELANSGNRDSEIVGELKKVNQNLTAGGDEPVIVEGVGN